MAIGFINLLYETDNALKVEWRIEEFLLSLEKSFTIQSHIFNGLRTSWQITMTYKSSRGEIQLYLHNIGKRKGKRYIKFFFGIRLKGGAQDFRCCLTKTFCGTCSGFGTQEFILKPEIEKRMNELLPEGIFTIICSIAKLEFATKSQWSPLEDLPLVQSTTSDLRPTAELNSECPSSDIKGNSTNTSENQTTEPCLTPTGVDRLLENLKKLLLDGQNSDIVLKVEDREFNVHKVILTARSPVFESMFQYDTKENISGTVDIPDCSAEAFHEFLLYIYTGRFDNMSCDNVFDLYYAADKYQVYDLKSECVEYMEYNLSVENFCTVMTLSLRHSETNLQKKTADFFCHNVKAIIKTVQWQNYLEDYPTEANELIIKAFHA